MHGSVKAGAAIDLVGDNGLSRYQKLVVILCATIALLDGFDTQAIGFVAPVIAQEWAMPLAAFGPIFAVGLLGGLVGAVLFGLVADRYGRRITLLLTVALFALGSLVTPLATTGWELGFYRLVTGLGLGGAMPSIIALTSEYSPARMRTTLIVAMFCGFPLGAVVGAILSAPLIAHFGWESVFLLGGIVPILLLPILVLRMPESLGWLTARQNINAVNVILSRMGKPPVTIAALARADEQNLEGQGKTSIYALFTEGRLIGSLLIAGVFFVSLLLVFLMVSWIPAIAVESGLSVQKGVLAAAVLNITGIIGSLLIGAVSDRLGVYRIVGGAYLLGGAAVVLLALGAQPSSTIFLFCAVAGFFCIGAQMCVISIASQFYPVDIRATGVGWSMGMGRFGAIVGPLIGAALIGGTAGKSLFWIVSVLSILAGIGILILGLSMRRRK
ncbi:MFS transporter [Govanella unica]|uniref:MFS transporter n=1 Tax=Govanella unica TaxID=2975056 RepID=A0A9X3TZ32_9PROT|nr:MFS transporter [Govania unica]MDA5194443.1 MFS transporter [Govania unica]